MTGSSSASDLAPDVKSICDLFDPKYKGKVEMLTEMRDTVPLVMKCMGVDLSEATEDDWLAAINKLKDAVERGPDPPLHRQRLRPRPHQRRRRRR